VKKRFLFKLRFKLRMATQDPETERSVCVVSAGNAAHAMVPLFRFKGFQVRWWAPFEDEAERLQRAAQEQRFVQADFAKECEPCGVLKGVSEVISKDAKDVIAQSDIIVMPLPSFAYRSTLELLKPHLREGQVVIVTPAQGGFDWIAKEVLGDSANGVVFAGVLPMPFNCRTIEFGKKVHVQTLKKAYKVGVFPNDNPQTISEVEHITNSLFGGKCEYAGHFINCSLYPLNAVIHPQRLYVLLQDWKHGDILKDNPLFYEQVDKASTSLMESVNRELINFSTVLGEARPDLHVNVPTMLGFLNFAYQLEEPDLKTMFQKNPAYIGFKCPYIKVDGGFVPNLDSRYFTEDIPLGLCLYKGVAELVGVKTPTIDKVIAFMQEKMGKEYIKQGRLVGKDVGETTAPQRFGITNVNEL